MSEQTPESPAVVTMAPEDFDLAIEEAVERGRASAKSSDSGEPTRFAVYDTTYLKYVGDVVDSKTAAKATAKEHGLKADAHEIHGV